LRLAIERHFAVFLAFMATAMAAGFVIAARVF
jgi:hypothetical protein